MLKAINVRTATSMFEVVGENIIVLVELPLSKQSRDINYISSMDHWSILKTNSDFIFTIYQQQTWRFSNNVSASNFHPNHYEYE